METPTTKQRTTARALVKNEMNRLVGIDRYDTLWESDTLSSMNNREQENSLTDETVRHIAHLSRLALSDEEVTHAKEDLTSIFAHIECLNSINTNGVDPLDHPTELLNHIREDESTTPLTQEQVLFNAPAVKDVYFEVPKVLGDSS